MVRVAAVQSAPVAFDLPKSIDKVCDLVSEAKAGGAELVVLPEAFLSAYPRHWSLAVGYRTESDRLWYSRYVTSAVKIPENAVGYDWLSNASSQVVMGGFHAFARLCTVARDNEVYLSIGVIERSLIGSTVWCTNLLFGPTGILLSKHRKIKPTGAERIIWHEGEELNPATDAQGNPTEGTDNMPVVSTEIGKVGSLICWENYCALARWVLYKKGVEIYLAPTADGQPTWLSTMQHIALEGRVFIVSANQYQENTDFPDDYPANASPELHPGAKDKVWSRGGSCIVGPMGNVLAGPLWDEEGILFADLDLSEIHGTKLDFDPVGHYSREPLLMGMLAKLQ